MVAYFIRVAPQPKGGPETWDHAPYTQCVACLVESIDPVLFRDCRLARLHFERFTPAP